MNMLDNEALQRAVGEAKGLLDSPRDGDFIGRVFSGGTGRYAEKLRGLGFEGMEHVLDAGSGFGQWAISLAQLNRKVTGIELLTPRVRASRFIAERMGVENLHLCEGSIDRLPFADGAFDAVFSFSVVYYTDYRRTFAEFRRVLKPGGKLYLSTNGFGWYLFNLINNYNPSKDFDPRRYAVETMLHSLGYWLGGRIEPGKSVIMEPDTTINALNRARFTKAWVIGAANGADGCVPAGFYPQKYWGMWNVYEVMALA